jgi:hypothetical protein
MFVGFRPGPVSADLKEKLKAFVFFVVCIDWRPGCARASCYDIASF